MGSNGMVTGQWSGIIGLVLYLHYLLILMIPLNCVIIGRYLTQVWMYDINLVGIA